jgi:hypothetical protein
MATITKDQIGVLDINLIQGDNKTLTLVFTTLNLSNVSVPLDLRQYTAIRLDVKSQKDVNERPFFSFALGSGLAISGASFNVLTFTFTTQFVATAQTEWFYDIKFTSAEGVKHLVEGSINIQKIVTK